MNLGAWHSRRTGGQWIKSGLAKNRMRIRSRLLRGIAANGLGQIMGALIQIISVPVFIGFWGVELYGEWLILSALPAYLVMSDVGFASVTANDMTMRVSQGSRQAALSVFQSTWLLLTGISIVVIVVVLSVVRFIPFGPWFNLTHVSHSESVWVVVLLALHVLVGLQGKLLLAGFRCEGRYAQGTFLDSLVRLAEFCGVLAAVALGASPIVAALTFLILRILGTAGVRILLGINSPWIAYGYRSASFSEIRRLALPAFAFTGFPLGNAIKDQGLLTVIGVILGPASVVVFSTIRTIVNGGYQLMSMINQAVWPEISMAFGAKNMDLARELHRRACQASVWIAVFAILGLALFGEWVIQVWTLGKVTPDPTFFYLMLAALFSNSLWYASSMVPIAINKHETISVYYLVVTGVSLLLAIWITPALGLNGVVVTLLIIHAAMSFYVIRTSLSLLEDDPVAFLEVVMMPPSFRHLWPVAP